MSSEKRTCSTKFSDYCGDISQTERLLIIGLIVSVLTIIILTCAVLYNRQFIVNDCKDLTCIHQASQIMNQINQNINPCEDFYEFLCEKKFTEHNENKEDGSFLYIQQQRTQLIHELCMETDITEHPTITTAKTLYKACVNETQIEKDGLGRLREILRNVTNESNFKWTEVMYKLRKLGYPFSIFLNLGVQSDSKRTAVLKLSAPHTHRLHANPEDMKYYMKNIFEAIGKDRDNIEEEVNLTYEFLKKIQQPIKATELSSIETIQENCNDINWLEFIKNLVGPTIEISKNDFILTDIQALIDRVKLIANTPESVQLNYMIFAVVDNTIPYLNKKLKHLQMLFLPDKHETRSEFCVKTVEEHFHPSPLDIMYARKYLSQDRKEAIKHLVTNIKDELTKIITINKWMSNEYRNNVLLKLNAMKIIVGPEDLDEETLDQIDVDIMEKPLGNTFLDMLSRINRNHHTWLFNKINHTSPQWFNEHSLMPHYFKEDNSLYIPPASVILSFFDEKRPNYLNYGNLGSLIGQKLSNIANYSEEINDLEDMAEEFNKQINCLSSYNLKDEDIVYEALLNIGGLKVTYLAYENLVKVTKREKSLIGTQYKPNQLFWISTAPAFCKSINKGRRKGFGSYNISSAIINNLPQLLKDFNCAKVLEKQSEACQII